MKVLFALFFLGLVAISSGLSSTIIDKFNFRVANHLGPDFPAYLSFKYCGLPNVYVNVKDNNRVGFGQDIPAQANPNALGICPQPGCDSKRADVRDSRDDGDGSPDTLYASDSVVNFNIFWHADDQVPDRVLTRISRGDVAYVMGPDSSLAIQSVDGGSDTTTAAVPGDGGVTVTAKNYPRAVFNFNANNRMVMQNWYLEAASAPGACTPGAPNPNDLVSVYTVAGVTNENIASLSFKSRVRFAFDQSAAANGKVSVSVIWNSATQRFESHILGDSGASYDAKWIESIDIKVAIAGSGGFSAMINSTTTPTTTYIQSCGEPSGATSALLSK